MEHEEFHEQLEKACGSGGETGKAARAVLEVLRPHIAREEEFAIPPLLLLPQLAAGLVTGDMARVLSKTAVLKEELPRMLADHQRIVAALTRLMQAATEEKRYGFAKFAQKLILHAQLEEEVLYPAAILVGEYLRLWLEHNGGS